MAQRQVTHLVMARHKAKELLEDRIDKGQAIRLEVETANTPDALEEVRRKSQTWHGYNSRLLEKIFDTHEFSDLYWLVAVQLEREGGFRENQGAILFNLSTHINSLETILGQLDLIEEMGADKEVPATTTDKQKVFVVHGRDDAAKVAVADFLTDCGLEPIILHEQTDQGRTIIEKFEQHAGEAVFAVILWTPDDEGRLRNSEEDFEPRVRQNVVFEHGFFVGKLGRAKVCALRTGQVREPTDLQGVLYKEMEEGWQETLARELAAACIEINRAPPDENL